MSENNATREFTPEQDLEYHEARVYSTNEITRYAVEILEFYSEKMDRSAALGLTIEALSESLGNLISLVKEDFQQEVISSATQVIHQGIVSQHEIIAEMAYGQLGHA